MKLFHCDNCGSAVFFENVKCLHCASTLAFLPDRLSLMIRDAGRQDDFRAVFGDERADYSQALGSHYAAGAPANWQDSFVSAYATAHPWEDWAETWAHCLHMVDLLETAASYNTRLTVPGMDDDVEEVTNPFETGPKMFDPLVDQWVPLTLLLNSLNRSLGQDDAYPFALSAGALNKLRFIHDLIQSPHAQLEQQQPQLASVAALEPADHPG